MRAQQLDMSRPTGASGAAPVALPVPAPPAEGAVGAKRRSRWDQSGGDAKCVLTSATPAPASWLCACSAKQQKRNGTSDAGHQLCRCPPCRPASQWDDDGAAGKRSRWDVSETPGPVRLPSSGRLCVLSAISRHLCGNFVVMPPRLPALRHRSEPLDSCALACVASRAAPSFEKLFLQSFTARNLQAPFLIALHSVFAPCLQSTGGETPALPGGATPAWSGGATPASGSAWEGAGATPAKGKRSRWDETPAALAVRCRGLLLILPACLHSARMISRRSSRAC